MKVDKAAAWSVSISLPPSEEKKRRWTTNMSCTVVTSGGMKAAIDEVLREWPDATVWAVNHLGSRDVFLLDLASTHYPPEPKNLESK